MTIALTSIAIQHERRIRLAFSVNLAASAYTTLSYYGVTNVDGTAPDPGVEGALVVSNSPSVVELALGADLAGGALYLVTAVGVPGIDSTVTPGGTQDTTRWGQPTALLNVESPVDDLGALLYGSDLVHDGTDFVEGADGDLLVVSGEENAAQAVRRRLTGAPLPWDPTYSPNLRQYVDGPNANIIALRGAITRQAYKDDRVKSGGVTVTAAFDPNALDSAFLDAEVQLVGGSNPIPVKISVPAK